MFLVITYIVGSIATAIELEEASYIMFVIYLLATNKTYTWHVRNKVNKGTPTGIYATNKDMVHVLMNHINYYKEVYGVVPQNYVAELRTGFNNGCGLHQHNIAYLFK